MFRLVTSGAFCREISCGVEQLAHVSEVSAATFIQYRLIRFLGNCRFVFGPLPNVSNVPSIPELMFSTI
jgi:hypothetical protein